MASSENEVVYASRAQVQLAITALGAPDLLRLSRMAQIRSTGLSGCEWNDLLHDAISRALDGSRRWPAHVPLLVFLREVMRSLASEIRRRQQYEGDLPQSGSHGEGNADPDAWQQVASMQADPERIVLARDMLQKVERLFANDPSATAVIAGLAEGHSPDHIQSASAMSAKDYDSTRRRIRRTLARTFPERF